MKEIDIKQKNVCNDIELRSEKVRNLLGEIPPAFVRWGSVIIVAIFLVLLLVLCFVPYPHSKGESILQHFLLVIYTNYN
ncbi:hypothetical protein [Prevotella sp.]|uniref:hypothetical protein n=1 Tax=Prevotella sp. TaxID=59823 RepID=UPI00307950FF